MMNRFFAAFCVFFFMMPQGWLVSPVPLSDLTHAALLALAVFFALSALRP